MHAATPSSAKACPPWSVKPALQILLILYCRQALARFAIHFLLPYEQRIRKMEQNYAHDHRTIARFDDITLAVQLVMVALLFLTGVQYLGFLTGIFVGMSLIQL